MLRRPILAAVLALTSALALPACGSSAKSASATSSTGPTTSASAPAARGCARVSAPVPRTPSRLRRPTLRLDPKRRSVVRLTTTCGEIDIALDVRRAPRTSASFASLVKHRFFDGLGFHRVAQGFVIQAGDPSGTGSGGPGYTVVERPPAHLRYTRGVVAMAKTQTEPSGSSGSQFFIVTGQSTPLPPDYALLGHVVKGLDAADRIGAIPTNPPGDGAPSSPVVITKAMLAG